MLSLLDYMLDLSPQSAAQPPRNHKSLPKQRLYLEEPLQPPNLKDPLTNQNAQLEDTPPLDPRIRALRRVSVRPLSDHDIPLFVLDLVEQLIHRPHLLLDRLLRGFGFGHVDDAVDVEGDFFRVGRPVLVAETVRVAAVVAGCEAVVAAADAAFVDLVRVRGVLDLEGGLLVGLLRIRLRSEGVEVWIKLDVPRSRLRGFHCLRIHGRPLGT